MSSLSRFLGHGMTLTLATLGAACGGHAPAPWGAAPATMAAGPLPHGPAAPVRGLPMPSLDLPWTPPMLVAGDLEQLRVALAGYDSVALQLGDRFGGPEQAARVEALLQAIHPGITTVVAEPRPFAGVPLPLPLEREPDDGEARPRYRWTLGSRPTTTTASAVLELDDAALEAGRWRGLAARAVGSCDAPMAALAVGQEQSLAELEPFLDHADATLWQVYRPALQAIVPRLRAELQPYEAPRTRTERDDDGEWAQYQCGHAYWEYLQAFARCGAELGSCAPAPRVFLMGGARIGTAEPSVYVPEGCGARLGRDYVLELRSVASESAQVAQEHLAASWVALADRVGAITEVYEALEDVCKPRRRRFDPADLEAARGRLAAIGDDLASDALANPQGRWTSVEEPFHVPGYGPVQQVAIYHGGPGSASETAVAEARALRELVLGRALCRSAQPSLPLAIALVDAHGGAVEFFGYFFEEELACGALAPLWAEPSSARSVSVARQPTR